MSKKILVAHPQKQHSYHLVEALNNDNFDVLYVTTAYNKKGCATSLLAKLLPGKNGRTAQNKRINDFDDNRVIVVDELLGLFCLALFHLKGKLVARFRDRACSYLDRLFSMHVVQIAKEFKPDAIVAYDKRALGIFTAIADEVPKAVRVLDCSAAPSICEHLQLLNDFKTANLEELNEFQRYLQVDCTSLLSSVEECRRADYFLAASNYVKNSLTKLNVSAEKILLCRYGSNFCRAEAPASHERESRAVNFIYCGRLTPQKGIHHLLKAFSNLDGENCSLTLIGAYDNSSGYFDSYLKQTNKYRFLGQIPHTEVEYQLGRADVFVFPSLSEGMSLACLEALGMGLPLIASDSSGVNDLIQDGVNGFVVRTSDSNDLESKMQWFIDNGNMLHAMSAAAYETSLTYRWHDYNRTLAKGMHRILQDG